MVPVPFPSRDIGDPKAGGEQRQGRLVVRAEGIRGVPLVPAFSVVGARCTLSAGWGRAAGRGSCAGGPSRGERGASYLPQRPDSTWPRSPASVSPSVRPRTGAGGCPAGPRAAPWQPWDGSSGPPRHLLHQRACGQCLPPAAGGPPALPHGGPLPAAPRLSVQAHLLLGLCGEWAPRPAAGGGCAMGTPVGQRCLQAPIAQPNVSATPLRPQPDSDAVGACSSQAQKSQLSFPRPPS